MCRGGGIGTEIVADCRKGPIGREKMMCMLRFHASRNCYKRLDMDFVLPITSHALMNTQMGLNELTERTRSLFLFLPTACWAIVKNLGYIQRKGHRIHP